jgi:hypothetical protein
MKSFWILPHQSQSGELEVLKEGAIRPLLEVVDISSFPPALVLGVPEDVLRSNPSEDFLYAEFARCRDHSSVFSQSIRAGKDREGRTILLTHVQVFEKDEQPQPRFPLEYEEIKDELEGVIPGDLLEGIASGMSSSSSIQRVNTMLEYTRRRRSTNTFASETSERSANPHQWRPQKKKPDRR